MLQRSNCKYSSYAGWLLVWKKLNFFIFFLIHFAHKFRAFSQQNNPGITVRTMFWSVFRPIPTNTNPRSAVCFRLLEVSAINQVFLSIWPTPSPANPSAAATAADADADAHDEHYLAVSHQCKKNPTKSSGGVDVGQHKRRKQDSTGNCREKHNQKGWCRPCLCCSKRSCRWIPAILSFLVDWWWWFLLQICCLRMCCVDTRTMMAIATQCFKVAWRGSQKRPGELLLSLLALEGIPPLFTAFCRYRRKLWVRDGCLSELGKQQNNLEAHGSWRRRVKL